MTDQQQGLEAHVYFQTPGCLSRYFNDFSAKLSLTGYTPLSIGSYQHCVAHFDAWLQYKRIDIDDIDAEVVTAFAEHRCTYPVGRRHKILSPQYAVRVQRFIRYLNEQGVVKVTQEKTKDLNPTTVVEFSDWILCHRGITTHTVERYTRLIVALLPMLGDNPATYNAVGIRQVIETKAAQYSCATAKTFATALRAYLRFLASQGRCRAGLEAAVPTFPQWRLSALPRYLVSQEVERVINSCDRDTRCGLRDRAILLLLARLGLRAGDIVNMRFEDVDWDKGLLRVHGKGRREVRLPLPQDAGDALLTYLEQMRPPVVIDRVFLCANAPHRAFSSSTAVSTIVRSALARAGISNPPSKGANLLRHSAATSMLRAGATLDAISTVLRHRSLDATAHYAKVDILMLRTIVQPWPQEDIPC